MEFLIPSRRERPVDDPIFTLNAEAKARKAAGDDVINATIGTLLDDNGKLMTMPAVLEALASVPDDVGANYAPIPGRDDFRAAVIEDLLGSYGLADRACAVATPGGSGALRIAIDDFLDYGQTAIATSYFWGPYRTLCDESGRKLETFNMFNAAGGFDTAALDQKLGQVIAAQGRALLILNTPCHNPTGFSLDAAEWAETTAILERHAKKAPVVLLLDIAYAYFAAESLVVALDALKNVVDELLVLYAWSASKSFAQYGLRVGALVATTNDAQCRTRICNALTYSCRGLWSNCTAGGQYAIARVLTEPLLAERAKKDRAALVQLLARRVVTWNKLAGRAAAKIRYPRYQGGFFTTVLVDDPRPLAAALRDRGIFVVPTTGALRIAMCSVTEPQIERIVAALIDVLP